MSGKAINDVDSLTFFKNFKYVGNTYSHYSIVSEWCEEHFGEFGDRWYRLGMDPLSDTDTPCVYFFKNDKDFVLFKLRWS